jgi:hypothetical protein
MNLFAETTVMRFLAAGSFFEAKTKRKPDKTTRKRTGIVFTRGIGGIVFNG